MQAFTLEKDVFLEPSREKLIRLVAEFISNKKFVVCKNLNRRKIRLDRYLVINSGSRSTKNRYQAFFASLELIERGYIVNEKAKLHSYEFTGITKTNKKVVAHVREDKTISGREPFLVGCYWRQN